MTSKEILFNRKTRKSFIPRLVLKWGNGNSLDSPSNCIDNLDQVKFGEQTKSLKKAIKDFFLVQKSFQALRRKSSGLISNEFISIEIERNEMEARSLGLRSQETSSELLIWLHEHNSSPCTSSTKKRESQKGKSK